MKFKVWLWCKLWKYDVIFACEADLDVFKLGYKSETDGQILEIKMTCSVSLRLEYNQ